MIEYMRRRVIVGGMVAVIIAAVGLGPAWSAQPLEDGDGARRG